MYIGMISASKHFYPLKAGRAVGAGYGRLPCLSFRGSGHFLTGSVAVFPRLNVLHVIALQADFWAYFRANFHIFCADFRTGSESARSEEESEHVEDLRDLDEDHKDLDEISGSHFLFAARECLVKSSLLAA